MLCGNYLRAILQKKCLFCNTYWENTFPLRLGNGWVIKPHTKQWHVITHQLSNPRSTLLIKEALCTMTPSTVVSCTNCCFDLNEPSTNATQFCDMLNWFGINSLWPSDTIWWHRPGLTLAWVMAYYLTAQKPLPDLSSARSSDIHLKTISLETPQTSISEINLKITHLNFPSNLPGANEFHILM